MNEGLTNTERAMLLESKRCLQLRGEEVKFERRNNIDCIVIAEYKGIIEGCTLCYWADDCSLVVWSINKYDDWKATINGDYFKLDSTQKIAEIIDHPNSHNSEAFEKARLRFWNRMQRCDQYVLEMHKD